MSRMEPEIQEIYIRAGKIVARALEEARKLIKPGTNLIDVCNSVEGYIREHGAIPAFPLNIGINEIAAHYTSPPNDKSVIPNECVVKLDCGAAIDGYTTDMAISLAVGTEKYDYLITAAQAGLEKAISLIKPGIDVRKIGVAVQETIRDHGARVISNLMGHQMKQFNLHAGVSVPNVKTVAGESYTFKEGDVFAIEPFSTNGTGYVKNGPKAYIYALLKKNPKNVSRNLVMEINKIWQDRQRLPFAPRWYHRIKPADLNQLRSRHVLTSYPILVEVKKGVVAQAEHTVLVTKKGCEVVTTL